MERGAVTNLDPAGGAGLAQSIWNAVQVVAWSAGMFVWAALVFWPQLGLHLLWNVLIPVAPALMVLAPGVWRNVCPLGTIALAPRRFGVSRDKKLSPVWRARLFLMSFVLLMVVVPLRKVVLDTNGPLLAALLGVVGLLAMGMGFVFKWKSGWCSSLCPVYPVELLYGSRPLLSVPNAHCTTCQACVGPCSDSTKQLTPGNAVNTPLGKTVGIVFTGWFPGFVWGWYHVPIYRGWEGFHHLGVAFGFPFAAALATLGVYLGLRRLWPGRHRLISSLFAAAAIIVYYWFRLPAVFGIGDPAAAMIVDISSSLPAWSAAALRVFTIVFFGWLMVGRQSVSRAWGIRPVVVEPK